MTRFALAALTIALVSGSARADVRVRPYDPVEHADPGRFADGFDPLLSLDDHLLEADARASRPRPAPVPRVGQRARLYPEGALDLRKARRQPRPAPVREGFVVERHPNGQKALEGTFRAGRPDGLVIRWHANGQKAFEGTFSNGQPHGYVISWHPNGTRATQGVYSHGAKDGFWTTWYENGTKRSEGTYRQGRPAGFFVTWHPNGQKASERVLGR